MNQLSQRQKKVAYYAQVYSNMHKGIVSHGYFLNSNNCTELDGMSFVFIAVDLNSVRQIVIRQLLSKKIPFIDVGLGVLTVDDSLIGTLRWTLGRRINPIICQAGSDRPIPKKEMPIPPIFKLRI